MLAKLWSFGLKGIDGFLVSVEVDIASGLPSFSIVGLPDAGIRESKNRIFAAIRNSGFDFPSKRITVNLGPAELRKAGTHFDLPIAIGILVASGQVSPAVKQKIERAAFIGELALDGNVRPVLGVFPMALSIKDCSEIDFIVVPKENESEAASSGTNAFYVENLKEIVEYLNDTRKLNQCVKIESSYEEHGQEDFSEVKNQAFAKRALEIAAAGSHNILMVGPPGAGKSMLAKRFGTILPPLTFEESLEVTKIHSISGTLKNSKLVSQRPFRDPHHTISDMALIGGGTNPRPGEVSLAHNGCLFLDEFPEFSRNAIESLREPLESFKVTVSRVKESITFPARFILIAAMNPCPCGYFGHPTKECSCTPLQIHKYRSKISGPVLDRIDIHVQLSPIKYDDWAGDLKSESSEVIRNRVLKAREIQKNRFHNPAMTNAHMSVRQIKEFCKLPDDAGEILESAMNKFGFSARSLDRMLKVSRTIADLNGSEKIKKMHIIEAMQYRILDKSAELICS